MRGTDVHYRLPVDFLEAVNGATKRVTLPDGATLDVTVPAGAIHRLSNPVDLPLRLIEVALGTDLDDIRTERLDPPETGHG